MPAGRYELTVEEGATFRKTFVWSRIPAGGTVSSPVLLVTEGWEARAQVRPGPGQDPVALTFDTRPGDRDGTIALTDLGEIALFCADELTADLGVRRGWWALELEDQNGEIVRLLEGPVTVTAETVK